MVNNLIITGITGFVGTNLKAHLTNSFDIKGVSRFAHNENCIAYEDITIDRLNEVEAIVHLAGKAHDKKKTSEDSEYFEVNTILTERIFNQFLKSNSEVFIYMSSVKAVADEIDGVLTEDVIPNPVTAYGKSKLAAEEYILSNKIPSKKRVYILRPCMIYGPKNKGNLNLLYTLVSKRIPYPFGKFHNKRSFLAVENLCFVINEILSNPSISSGVYNIADDQPLSTVDLVRVIGDSLDKKVKIFNLSPALIKKIAKIGDYLPIPLNSEKLKKLTDSFVVSNKKIKRAIKKELPLTTIEGLEQTFKNYDKNL